MDNNDNELDEQVRLLKKNYDVENLEDVPHAEVFAEGAYSAELRQRWLDSSFNIKQLVGIAFEELEFLEYQAGVIDDTEGIDMDDPTEVNNVLSSEEVTDLIVRFADLEHKFRHVKNARDRYSHKKEHLEKKVGRLEDELEDYRQAGRLHHLKRLVLG